MAFIQQIIRFTATGFLNTAVDFAVINSLIFYFHVSQGTRVGVFAVISFTVAVLHSYFWNKYWAFSSTIASGGFLKNVWQFVVAAIVGAVFFGLSVFGASKDFPFYYYLGVFAVLLLVELLMWKGFRLQKTEAPTRSSKQFLGFIIISLIGALINFVILKFGTSNLDPLFGLAPEVWANVMKALATGVSLIWNFLGYKIVVFRT